MCFPTVRKRSKVASVTSSSKSSPTSQVPSSSTLKGRFFKKTKKDAVAKSKPHGTTASTMPRIQESNDDNPNMPAPSGQTTIKRYPNNLSIERYLMQDCTAEPFKAFQLQNNAARLDAGGHDYDHLDSAESGHYFQTAEPLYNGNRWSTEAVYGDSEDRPGSGL